MNEVFRKSKDDRFKWIAIAISVVTLPGIVDGLVVWREWLEVSWMAHWRTVKLYIVDVLLFWLPFRVPSGTIEYLIFGSVTYRSILIGVSQGNDAGRKFLGAMSDHHPYLLAFLSIALWPFVFMALLFGDYKESKFVRPELDNLLKAREITKTLIGEHSGSESSGKFRFPPGIDGNYIAPYGRGRYLTLDELLAKISYDIEYITSINQADRQKSITLRVLSISIVASILFIFVLSDALKRLELI